MATSSESRRRSSRSESPVRRLDVLQPAAPRMVARGKREAPEVAMSSRVGVCGAVALLLLASSASRASLSRFPGADGLDGRHARRWTVTATSAPCAWSRRGAAVSSFTTPLELRYLDGRTWCLISEFDFASEVLERMIRIPAGCETDFASIPRVLWNVLPPTGSYGKAAVVHDFCIAHRDRRRGPTPIACSSKAWKRSTSAGSRGTRCTPACASAARARTRAVCSFLNEGSMTDMIDLSTVKILNSPDVHAWPATTAITRLELRTSGVHCRVHEEDRRRSLARFSVRRSERGRQRCSTRCGSC
jgi:hypothetical protein